MSSSPRWPCAGIGDREFHGLRARWGSRERDGALFRLGGWDKRKRKRKHYGYEYHVLIFHNLFPFIFGLPTFLGRRSLGEVGWPFIRVLSEIRSEVTRKAGWPAVFVAGWMLVAARAAVLMKCKQSAVTLTKHDGCL